MYSVDRCKLGSIQQVATEATYPAYPYMLLAFNKRYEEIRAPSSGFAEKKLLVLYYIYQATALE